MDDRTAARVTGLGVKTSIGADVLSFEKALREGASGITRREGPVPAVAGRFSDFNFERDLAEMRLPEELAAKARRVARRSPLSLQCSALAALEAWRAAGFVENPPEDDTRLGIVVAGQNISSGYQFETAGRFRAEPEYLAPSYALHFLDTDQVGALSELFGARGEGLTTGGASASGNVALITGLRLVRQSVLDVCLVVGALADISPVECRAFTQLGAMGSGNAGMDPARICRPFDARRSGFVYGQGSACLVLEKPARAGRRGAPPWGSILGGAVCLDGNRSSELNPDGVARAMGGAAQDAGLVTDDIEYVNAHATSSVLGDDREALGIKRFLGDRRGEVWVNSTKELTGHCLWAAGVVEAAAVLIQLKGGFLHPNPNLETPVDPDCRFVGPRAREGRWRTALSNGFGFGGFNTSVALRSA
jgi:malonyl-ACP decarboxylase